MRLTTERRSRTTDPDNVVTIKNFEPWNVTCWFWEQTLIDHCSRAYRCWQSGGNQAPDCPQLGVPEAQEKSQQQQQKHKRRTVWHRQRRFAKYRMGTTHILSSAAHKCMLLTNVAPFKREIIRLSSGMRFIAEKHCYNKEIICQTEMLLFCLFELSGMTREPHRLYTC